MDHSLPRELVAEILTFIADHEPLTQLERSLDSGHSLSEIRSALREVARLLERPLSAERDKVEDVHRSLSREARKVFRSLSPREGQNLLKAFGFFEG